MINNVKEYHIPFKGVFQGDIVLFNIIKSRGRWCLSQILRIVCLVAVICAIFGIVSNVEAGEISVLAPTAVESTMYSRNKIVNVVVRVSDSNDLNLLSIASERDGSRFDPIGRYVKNGVYFVHYSLPLKRGANNFV